MRAGLSHRWNLSFPAAARLQARLRGLLRHTPPRRPARRVAGAGVAYGVARRLRRRPGLLPCDGQGPAHPRRFGLACHLGLLPGVPGLGVAKSLLVGDHRDPGPAAGSRAALLDRGEVVGAALRTRARVRPIDVSFGHRSDLRRAVRQVMACCRGYRLPEPVRQAHQQVTRLRKEAA